VVAVGSGKTAVRGSSGRPVTVDPHGRPGRRSREPIHQMATGFPRELCPGLSKRCPIGAKCATPRSPDQGDHVIAVGRDPPLRAAYGHHPGSKPNPTANYLYQPPTHPDRSPHRGSASIALGRVRGGMTWPLDFVFPANVALGSRSQINGTPQRGSANRGN